MACCIIGRGYSTSGLVQYQLFVWAAQACEVVRHKASGLVTAVRKWTLNGMAMHYLGSARGSLIRTVAGSKSRSTVS
jgi:hypothetical protein